MQDAGNSSKDSQTKILNYATNSEENFEESDISPVDSENENSTGKHEITFL